MHGFLFLGNFESIVTFFTLTFFGSNYPLCSEFICSVQLNVVEKLDIRPYWENSFIFQSFCVYILSFIIRKGGTYIFFGALLTNVFPPVRSLILFLPGRKVILPFWCLLVARDTTTFIKIKLVVTYDPTARALFLLHLIT